MIGGVCAGLARYFELDVTLVRAIFIASTIFGGFGLAVYVALWVLADPASTPDTASTSEFMPPPDPASSPLPAPASELAATVDEGGAELMDEIAELSQNPVVSDA